MTRSSEPDVFEPGRGPLTGGPVNGPVYPVGLVVRGRRCLVVGGGRVAGCKIRSLLQCGAAVTVMAREVHEALGLLAADGPIGGSEERPLDVQLRDYERGDAIGYRLVVAASGDSATDAAVYEDAEEAGVWVNSADDPAHCSMMLPAVWRSGPVTVSVATDGSSPALAGWLRTKVAESMGAQVGQLAVLLGEVRREIRGQGRPTDSVDWLAVLEGPVPTLVAQGRLADARAALRSVVGSLEKA